MSKTKSPECQKKLYKTTKNPPYMKAGFFCCLK